MVENLTLYTAKVCPYAHRAELALAEANAPYTRFEIDLQHKPEWYASKVNLAGKVPAIAYGGPAVPADSPSPSSTKLAESLILVEFVADLYPTSTLLPKDPVLRAQARFFIDAVGTSFNPVYFGYVRGNETLDGLIAAFEKMQTLMPPEGTFAVGDSYSIADVAFVPFVARLFVALESDLGTFKEGEGPRALGEIQTSTKLERFQRWWGAVSARPSFTSTFDKEHIIERLKKRIVAANFPRVKT